MTARQRYLEQCGGDDRHVKHVTGTRFAKKCFCPTCWLCMVYVVGIGGPCEAQPYPASDLLMGLYSIRSTAEPGVVSAFDLPINVRYLDDDCTTILETDEVVTLNPGMDTGGEWEKLTTIAVSGGPTLHVYYAAFSAADDDDPKWCDHPEFACPLDINYATFPTDPHLASNAGPIDLSEVVPLADADVGPMPDVGFGTGLYIGRGFGTNENYVYCHDELGLTLAPHGIPVDDDCALNAYDQDGVRLRSFNKATFATPASPISTDTAFTLTVTFVNWFEPSQLVDGTHPFNPPLEADVDTPPEAEIVGPLVFPDEDVTYTGITRLSYGVYRFENMKLRAVKGTRRFAIFPEFERVTFKAVSKGRAQSADITLTAGAAAFVDLVPIDPDFDPVLFQIGEPLLHPDSSPIVARVLDAIGQFRVYNVVDGATNTIVMHLDNNAGNAITSPTLDGTTSTFVSATSRSKAAVDGIAEFDDLSAHALGRNYELRVSSSGLGVSSNANWREFPVEFWVGLRINDPGPQVAGVPFNITVDLVKFDGTIVSPNTIDNLTLSGTGSFTGYGTQAPVAGTATFSGNFPAAGTYTVQVVTSGTTYDGPPTTVSINVVVS